MEFQLTTPAEPTSPVTGVTLISSVYLFLSNGIVISLKERRADGSETPAEMQLAPAEVETYFATPLSPAGFRATFVQAFIAAVQARYPTAQVVG